MQEIKAKITPGMRDELRIPLPAEAVSVHPTKTYLSSIKSIYVAERINDVFGIGSWTLKSTVVEMGEKMIVLLVALEIPEYGFYGEAYGGNDNQDRGDAYKGATTDGFTKIAAQQLEIGIDVFKGLSGSVKPKSEQREHWCAEHDTAFFKKGKMKSYAHPIKDTGDWCHEHHKAPAEAPAEAPKKTPRQELADAINEMGYTPDDIRAYCKKKYNKENSKDLTEKEIKDLTFEVINCQIPKI